MTILACKSYGGQNRYLADSPTLADVDATNLAASFSAPPSGKVLVKLTGHVDTEPNNEIHFGLREGSTVVAPKSLVVGGGSETYSRGVVTVGFVVEGLNPGSTHTYKWAFASNGEATLNVDRVDGYPPAVIEIHALP